ncbi:MAG: MCE family protein [Proteobacteria bacterium]|nr:MCE family protein [Pseudomonadota bacterium]
MSEKPNTVAIGAFVIGAALIAISAILFISGSGWGGDKNKVVMVFEGSVKGLTVGAPIALRGVQIGQVTNIHLIFDTDSIDITMTVEAEIDGNRFETRGKAAGYLGDEMIARGLRAQLNSQSMLTGLLYIQLDFHPNTPANIVDIDSPYSQIPTIPTDLQRITRELESMDFAAIAEDIQTIADSLAVFVSTKEFQQLPADLHNTLASFESLSDQLNVQMASSGPKLDKVLDETYNTMETLDSELPKISASALQTLKVLDAAMLAFEETIQEIDDLVSDDSATTYALNKALREISLAARELQLLAKTLEEHPEALIRGRSEEDE